MIASQPRSCLHLHLPSILHIDAQSQLHLPTSTILHPPRLGQRNAPAQRQVIFSEFDPEPLASASIAQVHKARLRSTNQIVAVKAGQDGRRMTGGWVCGGGRVSVGKYLSALSDFMVIARVLFLFLVCRLLFCISMFTRASASTFDIRGCTTFAFAAPCCAFVPFDS